MMRGDKGTDGAENFLLDIRTGHATMRATVKILNRLLTIFLFGTAFAFGNVEAIKNLQSPCAGKPAAFTFGGELNREFMLDGKPFQIRSGEMHPQRIPRSYWRQRIRAAKALGLNTIAFYTYWNTLEGKNGEWDFSGNKDIAAFIDLCAEEGMWVLFRPGPYVCGEWDLGGLPTYLIAENETMLRTTKNGFFMKAQERYLEKMAEIAIPRLAKNGGPILMIQLENEYGSYKTNHDELAYIEWIKAFWEKKGAGPFYLSEGTARHHLRFIPEGVAIGLDPAEREEHMSTARSIAPNVPIFSSETYPGWLRHWGEGNWRSSPRTLDAVRWYMSSGTSFNLFVLHGGTNFGLTAGANCAGDGSHFQPDLTSYDYGSPIGEHGNYAPEYEQYRSIITSALPQEASVPEPPATPPCMEIAPFTPELVCRMGKLFSDVPDRKHTVTNPVTLESLGQNQGMALYQTTLPAGPAAKLECRAHDYAQVYVGDQFIGVIDRMKNGESVDIPERTEPQKLSVLVDTFGHINFSSYMEKDRKGIIGEVKLGGTPIPMWEISLLPLESDPTTEAEGCQASALRGALFSAEIKLEKAEDTFLDMSHWEKGYVWVNGHNLGRYWNIGAQQRLYCPAEFLKAGVNTVQILDTHTDTPRSVRGCVERNVESAKQTENLNNDW